MLVTNTAFCLDGSQFGVARTRAFAARARQAGVRVAAGWGSEGGPRTERGEDADGLIRWLLGLPRPCGLFTCADHWARIVARAPKAQRQLPFSSCIRRSALTTFRGNEGSACV